MSTDAPACAVMGLAVNWMHAVHQDGRNTSLGAEKRDVFKAQLILPW